MKTTPCLALALLASLSVTGLAQSEYEYDKPPVSYSDTPPNQAVTQLEARIAKGELSLTGDGKAVLRELLGLLKVPEESQVLVYSKTSFQTDLIRPTNPRCLYFNENTYIGWVPGGLMEVTVVDPKIGPVFYTFDPEGKKKLEGKRFMRDEQCLNCHGGTYTNATPGVFIRSVHTTAEGGTWLHLGSRIIDHTSPLEERWGGWYVTGQHGNARHMGNMFSREEKGKLIEDTEAGANVSDLAKYFDTGLYPKKTSDIVALMTLEHQCVMQNTLTRADFQTRRTLHMQQSLQRDLDEPVTAEPTGSTLRGFQSCARDVMDNLFFKGEAALPDGGIEGSEAFQTAFLAGAPKSKAGRSLREFQLLNRIFKYRCSYMVYSTTWQNLNAPFKKLLYDQLGLVLRGRDEEKRYAYLSNFERSEILKILADTLPDAPADWRGTAESAKN